MKRFEPVDIIMIILTITVCLSFILAIIRPLFIPEPMSNHGAEILKTILGTMLGSISMYVGLKFKK